MEGRHRWFRVGGLPLRNWAAQRELGHRSRLPDKRRGEEATMAFAAQFAGPPSLVVDRRDASRRRDNGDADARGVAADLPDTQWGAR